MAITKRGNCMQRALRRQLQAGFTLVELLIVVIILAVLAAIIVPQFSSATLDAKEAALDANLARMRSAIELFQAQHNGNYPGRVAATGATCPGGGTAGTGTAGSAQAFLDHMLMYSDVDGRACSIGDATFKHGPYLRKGVPHDSITGRGSVVADIVTTSTGAPIVPTVTTGGWAYDTRSGQIVMNSNTNDSRSRPYYTH
jgi:prepilin-type N-terminal cleavage/methylation domain-containing protein